MEEVSSSYEEIRIPIADSAEEIIQRKRDQRDSEVLQQYEFMQEDDEGVPAPMIFDSDEENDDSFVEPDNLDARALLSAHNLINDEKQDLREAMEILAEGGWRKFLQQPVIQCIFGPAFLLLGFFGIGKGTKNIEYLWDLLWQEQLLISTKLSWNASSCVACVNERSCGYELTQREVVNGRIRTTKLGFMGPKCYDLRFRTLRNLVDQTLLLPLFLNDGNFDDIVQRCLDAAMRDVVYANKGMDDAYKPFNGRGKRRKTRLVELEVM